MELFHKYIFDRFDVGFVMKTVYKESAFFMFLIKQVSGFRLLSTPGAIL